MLSNGCANELVRERSTGRQLMQMGRHDPEFELDLPSTRFLLGEVIHETGGP